VIDRQDIHEDNEALGDVLRGLLIFARYEIGRHAIEGEHDTIFVTQAPHLIPLTDEDRAKLESLGWLISTEYNLWLCFT
jgi:hypothetical protein